MIEKINERLSVQNLIIISIPFCVLLGTVWNYAKFYPIDTNLVGLLAVHDILMSSIYVYPFVVFVILGSLDPGYVRYSELIEKNAKNKEIFTLENSNIIFGIITFIFFPPITYCLMLPGILSLHQRYKNGIGSSDKLFLYYLIMSTFVFYVIFISIISYTKIIYTLSFPKNLSTICRGDKCYEGEIIFAGEKFSAILIKNTNTVNIIFSENDKIIKVEIPNSAYSPIIDVRHFGIKINYDPKVIENKN